MAARVQGAANNGSTSANSIAVTLSAIASGDAVCGLVTWGDGTATVTSVVDDMGNTYHLVDSGNDTTDNQLCQSFYLENITNAPTIITAHFSKVVPNPGIIADELSGIATTATPIDGHAINWQSAPGTGTDAVKSGAITTTADGCLIWGAVYNTGALTPAPSHGTGFTTGSSSTTNLSCSSEWEVQATHGTITNGATFTMSPSASTITAVIALKPAVVGGQSWIPRSRNTRLAAPISRGPFDSHFMPQSASFIFNTPSAFTFPTAGWVWNAQAPVDQLQQIAAQKSWVWNKQAPVQQLQLTGQKAWVWNKQAPALTAAIAAAQKGWVWAKGAPVLSQPFIAAQRAWQWRGQAPTQQLQITGQQKAWSWAAQAPAVSLVVTAAQRSWAWAKGAPVLSQSITAAQAAWRWTGGSPAISGVVSTAREYLYWVFGW